MKKSMDENMFYLKIFYNIGYCCYFFSRKKLLTFFPWVFTYDKLNFKLSLGYHFHLKGNIYHVGLINRLMEKWIRFQGSETSLLKVLILKILILFIYYCLLLDFYEVTRYMFIILIGMHCIY